MSDFTINYNLSFKEMLCFPVVSPYGLRHLRKKDLLNRIIGTIELFPLLGPLVSMIEGITVVIFKAVATCSGRQITKENPNRKIIEDFKANVLKNLEAKNSNFIPIELTKENWNTIRSTKFQTIVGQLYSCCPNIKKEGATLHGYNSVSVFSIPEIPEWIFKVGKEENSSLERRFNDTQNALNIIKNEELNFLHPPQQIMLDIEVQDRHGQKKCVKVLAEQKFDILENSEKHLFQYCLEDPELKPFIKECVKQLIILIIRTGYLDVRYDNNPLIMNGKGIALFDLDQRQSLNIVTSFVRGCSSSGEDGILSCLTPQLIDELTPFLRDNLSEEDFNKLALDKIKENLKDTTPEYKEKFSQHLKRRGISSGQEQVKFTKFFARNDLLSELQNRINESAKDILGIHLLSERKFYIYGIRKEESLLNQLKENGKIFDWRSDNGRCGSYYIYC